MSRCERLGRSSLALRENSGMLLAGSVRVFDLRDKEHSTIIYECPHPDSPLLRLGWNKQDPRRAPGLCRRPLARVPALRSSSGFLGFHQVFLGFHQIFLGFPRFSWVSLGFPGLS